ncbi:hypothetical protein HARCEL1_06135 [Halococcoides cellulosivorans]|uniref:Uncharacterized protein n=1 Tax=Halococcoides cellulosivorans TaxID=1679096 RepID=A0A2R4X0J1_9EURY|nr:hypothetical protein HARCEL1_06135 [Halococcoides cellulosivorans]
MSTALDVDGTVDSDAVARQVSARAESIERTQIDVAMSKLDEQHRETAVAFTDPVVEDLLDGPLDAPRLNRLIGTDSFSSMSLCSVPKRAGPDSLAGTSAEWTPAPQILYSDIHFIYAISNTVVCRHTVQSSATLDRIRFSDCLLKTDRDSRWPIVRTTPE